MRVAALTALVLFVSACAPATPAAPTQPAPATSAPAPTVAPATAPTTQPTIAPAAAPAPPTTAAATTGALIEASLANLSKTLHPYPDAASYAQPWIDASILIWGGGDSRGGLIYFDWEALDFKPGM